MARAGDSDARSFMLNLQANWKLFNNKSGKHCIIRKGIWLKLKWLIFARLSSTAKAMFVVLDWPLRHIRITLIFVPLLGKISICSYSIRNLRLKELYNLQWGNSWGSILNAIICRKSSFKNVHFLKINFYLLLESYNWWTAFS